MNESGEGIGQPGFNQWRTRFQKQSLHVSIDNVIYWQLSLSIFNCIFNKVIIFKVNIKNIMVIFKYHHVSSTIGY